MFEGEFTVTLKACLPSPHDKRHIDLEVGNKILLPPYCLQKIMDICKNTNMPSPLLFSLQNAEWEARQCIAGVLDFTAPEGQAVVPVQFIFANDQTARQKKRIEAGTGFKEGDRIHITNVTLNTGKSIKLQPHKYAFTELKNPKAILENELSKHYVSLTENDTICIKYVNQLYEFNVLETKPDPSICILNCDLNVDFAPPVEEPPKGPNVLVIGEIQQGSLEANTYEYYVFEPSLKDEKKSFTFEVEAVEGDPDLYISQDEKKPNRYEHTWSSAKTGGELLTIDATDLARNNNKRYHISIRAHKVSCKFKITVFLEEEKPDEGLPDTGFSLRKSGLRNSTNTGPEGHQKCENCRQWVSELNFQRHVAFCSRNNWRCPICFKNVKVTEKESHWHCEKCQIVTQKAQHYSCDKCLKCMPLQEKEKHLEISHTPLTCFCGQSFEMDAMLVHKKFDCKLRKEACQWCNEFLPFQDLPNHETQCGAQSTKCTICGRLVAQDKMVVHNFEFHDTAPSGSSHASAPQRETPLPESELRSSSHSFLRESVFSCPACQYRASSFDALQIHVQEKPECMAYF